MGVGVGGIRAVQEVKHSTRSEAAGTFVVFDSILIHPLINFALLAQLLFFLRILHKNYSAISQRR